LLGDAWNRRALVRGGGIAFASGLVLIATGGGFLSLLLALMLLSPASGAFVGLSQTVLMDLDPARHEQSMARWTLAGSLGVLAGPLLLTAAALAGWGWRGTFGAFALLALLLLRAIWRQPMPPAGPVEANVFRALRRSAAGALSALRRRDVLRWLTLIHFSDLMLDVLHGFIALYFVDVVGTSGGGATVAILVWTSLGLVGDALAIPLLERVGGLRYVRASAGLMLVVFPAFLLVGPVSAKLALLGVIGILNSGWYSVLAGRLYSALPGQSATVLALSSVFGIAGGFLPLAIALVAQHAGLDVAMWLLLAGPLALRIGVPRETGRRSGGEAVVAGVGTLEAAACDATAAREDRSV
jgi:FSR family fosmidomycin resistance protein-like MFS transporter